MAEKQKTKAQLLAEVKTLRHRLVQLEALESERNRAVEVLEESRFYAQSIVETVREPLLVLRADLRVSTANRAFYRFFRVTPEETENTRLYDLGNDQWNIPRLRTLLEEILPQNTHFDDFEMEHTFPTIGRKTLLLSARRVVQMNHHPPLILLALEDITERRRAERVLQQMGNWLDVTLTSIGDAVIATDTTAAITFMNPEAERLTGWTNQEALGRDVDEVLRLVNEETRELIESPIKRVLREGVVVRLANHIVLIARNGRETLVADSGAPIRGKEGTLYGVVMVFRDITERGQFEQAMVEAKETAEAANRTKSEFLATMSHELRTPLTVILGYLDLFQEGAFGPLPGEHSGILRRIDRNARELLDLVSAVLDMSRLEAGRLPMEYKEVQVAELLTELEAETQGLQEQSGLAFGWKIVANLPPIRTDPGKLKIVIKNLMSNAVKFTKQGSITVEALRHEGGVEISVTDTGSGIAEEDLVRIFEPFHQVESAPTRLYKGVGLGLHIVQRLLELLGGKIEVRSEVGRGSTFRVLVPTNIRTAQ